MKTDFKHWHKIIGRLGILVYGMLLLTSASYAVETNERISETPDGVEGNAASRVPSISADGRYVVFQSGATNLVSGSYGGVYIRDRNDNTLEVISQSTSGTFGAGTSPMISPDGQFVVFRSLSNLVAEDTNTSWDIYLRDRTTSTTSRVSVASDGSERRAVKSDRTP